MNRRDLIATFPILGAAAVIPAQATPLPFDLQGWLDTARTDDVVLYHLTQLTLALQRQHGGSWKGANLVGHNIVMAVQMDATGHDVWIEPHGGKV